MAFSIVSIGNQIPLDDGKLGVIAVVLCDDKDTPIPVEGDTLIGLSANMKLIGGSKAIACSTQETCLLDNSGKWGNWVSATTGAAGPKGDKGDAGAKGEKGDKGDPGVGLTGTAQAIAPIAEPSTASAEDIANKVNDIITKLKARGVIA